MDIIGQFIGFMLGMFSSWMFWRLLLNTKPNIAISPMVAYSIKTNTLTIKVINMGKRQAVDINVFVFIGEKSGETVMTTVYDPKFEENYRIALGPIQDLKNLWVLPTATRFKILDAKRILELLSSSSTTDRRIVFTLSATDALSSTKIIQRVTYRLKEVIPGTFTPGTKFLVENSIASVKLDNTLLIELLQND